MSLQCIEPKNKMKYKKLKGAEGYLHLIFDVNPWSEF